MANQELLDSIEKQRAAGALDETIRESLVAAGWAGEDVNGAFAVIALASAPPVAFASGDAFVSNHPYHNDWFSVCSIAVVILVGGLSIYAIYSDAAFSSFSAFVRSLTDVPTTTVSITTPNP